jgi:hypothetical protein
VDKNETITVSGSRTETVTKDETVTIDGARRVEITKADHLTVGDGWTQTITGNDVLSVSKKRSVEVGDEITFKTGDASLTLKKDGTFTLKGKDVTLIASGQINAKASTDVIIKGSKVAIEKNAGGGGGGAAAAKPDKSSPPEASPDGGVDAPLVCENVGHSSVAPSSSQQPSQPPQQTSSSTNTAAKKLTVQLDKEKVRCGTEVVLQATSENIDGGIRWDLKQEGKVVDSVAGSLTGGSARMTWNSKAQTNKKIEPRFSLVGSAGGLNADAPKNLTILKYEDNARETKTIACSALGFGWTGKFDIELKDGQITVATKIKLINRQGAKPADGDPLPAAGPAASDEDKRAMKADIESKLSNKRLFHRAGCKRGDGCSCPKGRGCCKISVRIVVEFVESGEHHVVNLFQGAGRANANNWTRIKTRDNSYAHETGHLLGFYDEYAGGAVGSAPRWKVQGGVVMSVGLTVPAEYYWDFRDWLKSKCSGEEWTVLLP